MRNLNLALIILVGLAACKNNGSNTASVKNSAINDKPEPTLKEIVIDAQYKPSKPDFQVLEISAKNDVLTVVFRYSGGCKDHDFNAYFSGSWLKSMPPQAIIEFEHLNPENDACRSVVKDTVQFNMAPLRYATSGSVVVKWPNDKSVQTTYEYGK
ncbi:MAG: hypothetical protein RL266_145 [Bacteroidota bacterium]|jgi:hypothetical protein